MSKTILVDFDGVIHSYTSGWQGITKIPDPPVSGAIEWLNEMTKKFNIAIYSSRSSETGGIQAMKDWLLKHGLAPEALQDLNFPETKPAAWLTIDDRCLCFEGTFPSIKEIDDFVPWYKR